MYKTPWTKPIILYNSQKRARWKNNSQKPTPMSVTVHIKYLTVILWLKCEKNCIWKPIHLQDIGDKQPHPWIKKKQTNKKTRKFAATHSVHLSCKEWNVLVLVLWGMASHSCCSMKPWPVDLDLTWHGKRLQKLILYQMPDRAPWDIVVLPQRWNTLNPYHNRAATMPVVVPNADINESFSWVLPCSPYAIIEPVFISKESADLSMTSAPPCKLSRVPLSVPHEQQVLLCRF